MFFCFVLLLFVPAIVHAQNYMIKTDNQTISIVVKPNNTIIVEPQNTTKLEKLVQTLADKQTSSWSRGDLIIASSTIVAFFSFGSFLIIRFKSTSRKQKLANLLDGVIASTFLIQVLHLSVIVAIVNGTFKDVEL